MQAGKLRHRVNIQTLSVSTGSRGQAAGSWSNLATDVPAEIVTLNGRELERARQIVATADSQIRLRWQEGITTESRIVFGSRVFHVGHINNIDQRNFELVLTCTEGL